MKLKEMGFNVSSEWVQACVEFCQSQIPNVSVDRLIKDVSEQWVNADITVEGTQAGPQIQKLSKDVVKGPVLQGRFVLQVGKFINHRFEPRRLPALKSGKLSNTISGSKSYRHRPKLCVCSATDDIENCQ